jgi:hypothetical protein
MVRRDLRPRRDLPAGVQICRRPWASSKRLAVMVVWHCSPHGLALMGLKLSVLTGKVPPFVSAPVTSASMGEDVSVPMFRKP